MKWELFKKPRISGWRSFGSIGKKVITFGSLAREAGFPTSGQYEFLFDRESQLIGLRKSDSGYKMRTANGVSLLTMPSSFRTFAGLPDGTILLTKCHLEDDVWILEFEK